MFNLTHQERKVILFLLIMALAGMGINFLSKSNSCVREIITFNQDIGKIDLNRADKEMLMSISGIGEKLAGRILEHRQQQGLFKDIEELKKIKGITSFRFEKIKDVLMVK